MEDGDRIAIDAEAGTIDLLVAVPERLFLAVDVDEGEDVVVGESFEEPVDSAGSGALGGEQPVEGGAVGVVVGRAF